MHALYPCTLRAIRMSEYKLTSKNPQSDKFPPLAIEDLYQA